MNWLRNLWRRLDSQSIGLVVAFVLVGLIHLFKNGQTVKTVLGAMPLARLEAELAGYF